MFTIVGKRFTPAEFREYVAGVSLSSFVPQFVVVHNTASPNLTQRPQGFTAQHIENLRQFFAVERGWAGGPHLFVDDNGIWVFNPLNKPGVHSPSWNRSAWGVELLGDYATDDPKNGRGAKVVANGAAAVAVLLGKIGLGVNAETVRLHKEDTLTDHDCPGKLIYKADFLEAVRAAGVQSEGWKVFGVDAAVLASGLPEGAQGTGLVRKYVEAAGGSLRVDAARREIHIVKAPAQ